MLVFSRRSAEKSCDPIESDRIGDLPGESLRGTLSAGAGNKRGVEVHAAPRSERMSGKSCRTG